jgi:hypothetical protein
MYFQEEKMYEQIVSKLTEEQSVIGKLFNEKELLKVQRQLEKIKTQTEKELLLLKVQCQNQVLQVKYETMENALVSECDF